MPLAGYAFNKNDEKNAELLVNVMKFMQNDQINSVKADREQKFIHCSSDCVVKDESAVVTRAIFTLQICEDRMEILDIDLISAKQYIKKMHFLNKIGPSGDACEFYEAEDEDGRHFLVQTVNRHIIDGEIEDKEFEVAVTITPFSVEIYENNEAYAEAKGFSKMKMPSIDGMPGSGQRLGIAEDFVSPGTIMTENSGDIFSMVLGKVLEVKEYNICFGDMEVPSYYVEIGSGENRISVFVGKEVLDNQTISVGNQLELFGDVKVDFSVGANSYY